MYLLYAFPYSYQTNSSIGFGRKQIEKATHQVLYIAAHLFLTLVILLLIFFDVGSFISILGRSDVTHGVCC